MPRGPETNGDPKNVKIVKVQRLIIKHVHAQKGNSIINVHTFLEQGV